MRSLDKGGGVQWTLVTGAPGAEGYRGMAGVLMICVSAAFRPFAVVWGRGSTFCAFYASTTMREILKYPLHSIKHSRGALSAARALQCGAY